eukprot:gb/GEZN01013497.1/.p1 GENE.gb/GEZN01013497.1/~~gb/GEZN01013497.1/.p1  ORF type:complete len:251 (-),score=4.85 gb/GEZN01013497.1/:169-921(-)
MRRQTKPGAKTESSEDTETEDEKKGVWLRTTYSPIRAYISGPSDGAVVLGIHDKFPNEDWHCWEPLQEPLAKAGFKVVLVDLPGHGESQKWDKSIAKSLVVMEIIQALEVDKVHLLGLGWGGKICVQVSSAHASRVLSLTLSAPDLVEKHRGLVERLSCPVFLCWARNDHVVPISHSTLVTSSIEHFKYAIFEKGAHYAAVRNVDQFAPMLIQFLNHGVGFWSHKRKGHMITVILLILLVLALALGFMVD